MDVRFVAYNKNPDNNIPFHSGMCGLLVCACIPGFGTHMACVRGDLRGRGRGWWGAYILTTPYRSPAAGPLGGPNIDYAASVASGLGMVTGFGVEWGGEGPWGLGFGSWG